MRLLLNGWQRVGIVASVLWVIGGGLAVRDAEIRRASAMYSATYGMCTQAAWEAYEIQLKGSWGNVAVASFLPLPFGWLLAYIVIGIWRWVKRGFKTSSPR